MDNKYQNIRIKINNQAEKLAALYFLAAKSGCKISDIVLKNTLNNNYYIKECPYVYVCGDIITAAAQEDGVTVEFSDLKNFDSYLKPQFVEVALNQEHTAKVYKNKIVVGCQTFPVSVADALVAAVKQING